MNDNQSFLKATRVEHSWRRLMAVAVALLVAALPVSRLQAQVGEHRNELAFGVNGGYLMSSVDFLPKVPQSQLGGKTGGLTLRYTCEKYFKSICAIVAEVNYAQLGWKEDILTSSDQPVPVFDPERGEELPGTQEAYSRKVNYLQIPIFARMGWGRERRGAQFYFQIGPQVSIFLNENSESNFDYQHPEKYEDHWYRRVSPVINQYAMPIENKFDYGIAGALGLEFSHRKLGHFMLEGRYYYGLGNIYGNSKRDYFAKSNYQNIVVKLSYLFDILKTNNPKIK